MTRRLYGVHWSVIVLILGCARGKPVDPSHRAQSMTRNDRSQCDRTGRDREVVESKSPISPFPNVRRVYRTSPGRNETLRTLVCREVDTNLDGIKDTFSDFDDKEQPLAERADTDYDGDIDTWISFASGEIRKIEIDRNADDQFDETRFYVQGKLRRVHKDNNRDGRPDVWESYDQGKLQRIGRDLDFDGVVDRWLKGSEGTASALASHPKPRNEPQLDNDSKNAAPSAPSGKQ